MECKYDMTYGHNGDDADVGRVQGAPAVLLVQQRVVQRRLHLHHHRHLAQDI